MAASKNARLCFSVADQIAQEVRALPVKDAARMLDTSLPMIRRLRAGNLSSVPILLKAIEQFGVRVIEPIIGRFDDESLFRRLDAIQASLDEVRDARTQPASAPASSHRRLGAAGGDRRGVQSAVLATGGQAAGPVSVIRLRRPLDDLAGPDRENLRRQVSAWRDRRGVLSIEDALAAAKGDNHGRIGVAIKRPGEAWELAHVASSHPFDVSTVDAATTREFDALASDPSQPWFLDTGATFVRDGAVVTTANWVARVLDRARNGTLILTAGFQPKAVPG